MRSVLLQLSVEPGIIVTKEYGTLGIHQNVSPFSITARRSSL